MTTPELRLANHALVVREGRILDVLPSALAAQRYAATVHVDRSHHLLIPGLVNAYGEIAPAPGTHPRLLHDGAGLAIAELLQSGTTCVFAVGFHPDQSARVAMEQGMRAVIGIPIAETASHWAKTPGEYSSRALNFRDEFRSHPTISTAFAPDSPNSIGEAAFTRIATLADELDAGIVMALHESPAAVAESVAMYGMRPIERMHALGLLTPALTAVHMVAATPADLALAQRSGLAIALCPEANYRSGVGPPPVSAWASTGLRLSLGSGSGAPAPGLDSWSALRLFALLSQTSNSTAMARHAWEAVAAATRGGAAALGLERDVGTLEAGKWADLCCVDLDNPALARASSEEPFVQLAFHGGRDLVSDVWISGRHLMNEGAFTRLDWPALAAGAQARFHPSTPGDCT